MADESLRRRLEVLNRQRLPHEPVRARVAATATARPAPRTAARPTPSATAPRPSGGLLARGILEEANSGSALVIRAPVEELWPSGPRLVAARVEHLRTLFERSPSASAPAARLIPDMAAMVAALPGRAVMLDLETCGLGGAALFLVGLLRQIDGELCVELLLARHYGEEAAVLELLWRRLAGGDGPGADVVVTFNGKSFDWPTVVDRSRRHLLHRHRELPAPHHVDILHHARRRWRGVLPDCKLQTIERLVCRRARTGDIPGSQIPAAYDAYVRTGHTAEMEAILHHNALDLVTLLDVAMRVAA